jgi:hypothetical protein
LPRLARLEQQNTLRKATSTTGLIPTALEADHEEWVSFGR